jgi:hypothetical protein
MVGLLILIIVLIVGVMTASQLRLRRLFPSGVCDLKLTRRLLETYENLQKIGALAFDRAFT